MTTTKKAKPAAPVCVFCKRTGAGVHFSIFQPRFQPFGTACMDCERTLPPGTKVPAPAPSDADVANDPRA